MWERERSVGEEERIERYLKICAWWLVWCVYICRLLGWLGCFFEEIRNAEDDIFLFFPLFLSFLISQLRGSFEIFLESTQALLERFPIPSSLLANKSIILPDFDLLSYRRNERINYRERDRWHFPISKKKKKRGKSSKIDTKNVSNLPTHAYARTHACSRTREKDETLRGRERGRGGISLIRGRTIRSPIPERFVCILPVVFSRTSSDFQP